MRFRFGEDYRLTLLNGALAVGAFFMLALCVNEGLALGRPLPKMDMLAVRAPVIKPAPKYSADHYKLIASRDVFNLEPIKRPKPQAVVIRDLHFKLLGTS